jgi:hypothetical protein
VAAGEAATVAEGSNVDGVADPQAPASAPSASARAKPRVRNPIALRRVRISVMVCLPHARGVVAADSPAGRISGPPPGIGRIARDDLGCRG